MMLTCERYRGGQQVVETRNGSDQVLKQQVWGLMYIDELVQIGLSKQPGNGADPNYAWAPYFYPLHDVQFNMMALVEEQTGRLVERYEYTPYGERTVYSHGWLRADVDRDGDVDANDTLGSGTAGYFDDDLNGDGDVDSADTTIKTTQDGKARNFTNDPLVSYATLTTDRGVGVDGQPLTALNEFGHQGLMHDEAVGLIHNRARDRNGERFLQRDPIGYPDGLHPYAAHHVVYQEVDPSGEIVPVLVVAAGAGALLFGATEYAIAPEPGVDYSGMKRDTLRDMTTLTAVALEPVDWILTAKMICADPGGMLTDKWTYVGLLPIASAAGAHHIRHVRPIQVIDEVEIYGTVYKRKPYQPNKHDIDWRGTGRTWQDAKNHAREIMEKKYGIPKDEWEPSEWGLDVNGKSFPTEYKHPATGAELSVDLPHPTQGPTVPHIGARWPKKGERTTIHIMIDEVPVHRPLKPR